MSTDRRGFLTDLARYAAIAATTPNVWRLTARPRLAADPFQLGVASGSPTPNGALLWTRLAPRPLEPDGGMDGQRVTLYWMVADDEAFARVVQRGRAAAVPELGYSLHVDVSGLAPNRWYFYRFATAGATGATSPTGRVRTTPADGATTPLRFAVASCQHYETGLFTAYRHLAAEELDLVTHLGDYIYEYGGLDGRVRKHAGFEIRTLDDYRRRYAQYKSDPLLQAAHARCPWIVTWDDHEVDNNYAALVGENGMESEEQMRARRAAAYQAWWENQPVRLARAASWADLVIYQSVNWGALARFWVLDTRQYRSNQPCDGGNDVVPCGDWGSRTHTVLGERQERWLTNGLAASRSGWQVLAQQIMVAPFDDAPGAERRFAMDPWSGYPAPRDRLLNAIGTHAPGRTVVLTGDIHSHWANELHRGFDRPDRPVVAAELVGSSISSGGDGSDEWPSFARNRAENPHIKWQSNRRGYISCTVTPDEWRADYRTVPFVSRPDAPVETPARWRLAHGNAKLERV